jgi:hypothetical protein
MKTRYKVLFTIIYTVVYLFLAIGSVNPEGTGTAIFFAPFITWLFLFVVLYLSSRLEDFRNRILFVLLMMAHYLVNIYFIFAVWDDSYKGESRLARMWELQPKFILLTVTWYLLGQLIIWILFFKSIKNYPSTRF